MNRAVMHFVWNTNKLQQMPVKWMKSSGLRFLFLMRRSGIFCAFFTISVVACVLGMRIWDIFDPWNAAFIRHPKRQTLLMYCFTLEIDEAVVFTGPTKHCVYFVDCWQTSTENAIAGNWRCLGQSEWWRPKRQHAIRSHYWHHLPTTRSSK